MSHLSPVSSGKEAKIVTFGNSPFQLYQPFAPSGDQPEAIDKLVEGIEDGLSFQTLLGVTGSGKTYTMANVIARLGRPAIVLHPIKHWLRSCIASSGSFSRITQWSILYPSLSGSEKA